MNDFAREIVAACAGLLAASGWIVAIVMQRRLVRLREAFRRVHGNVVQAVLVVGEQTAAEYEQKAELLVQAGKPTAAEQAETLFKKAAGVRGVLGDIREKVKV